MNISETDPIEKTAADDVNPLQEPISETPTMETPSQDVIPFGSDRHRSPQPQSWVIVGADLEKELPAFRGIFQSEETDGEGKKWGLVLRPDNEQLEKVEMHRITPETEGAQTSDPIAEPQIEKPQESDIPVTPKMDDFHTSSLKQEASEIFCKNSDCKRKAIVRLPEGNFCEKHAPAKKEADENDLLSIKAEAEQLLKTAEIWNLESEDEEFAADILNQIATKALEGDTAEQEYLRNLWNGESWESIAKKLQTEGSVWYVWFMDGVHAFMRDQEQAEKEGSKKKAFLYKEAAETFTCPVAVDISGENQLLGHEDVSFMKETAIKWTFELEMREWGVKSVYVSVPDQVINLQYEYFKEESVPGASDDGYVKEEKQVQITDAQVEGLDRTGFDSLAPQVLEYRDGKWVLDFGTSSHYSSKYPRLTRIAELPPEHICEQCKQPMGYQGFLGPICDKCVRKNHKKVTGSEEKEAAAPRLVPGMHVRVSEGSGLDSGRTGVIIDQREFQREIGTNERMVPNISGHYKPVDWTRQMAVRYDDDGSLDTMFKDRLFPIDKVASDFEKGISQNKTAIAGQCHNCGKQLGEGEEEFCAPCREELHDDLPVEKTADPVGFPNACDGCGKSFNFGEMWNTGPNENMCFNCARKNYPNIPESEYEKLSSLKVKADEPAVEPKTQYKELKRAPAYVDREKAVPASPELDVVLAKMDALEQNLATLDNAKKQIQAKMKEEIAKIEQSADRVQMEAELQQSIDKAGVLIDALENKVVSWRDKLYTMQTQEISYVPNLTPKEMLAKVYAKFEGAEAFVASVLNGMMSQAKNVVEKTLVKFPAKKSSMNKEASVIDRWNEELLAALKELSSPL
jgi:hypothetical protein